MSRVTTVWVEDRRDNATRIVGTASPSISWISRATTQSAYEITLRGDGRSASTGKVHSSEAIAIAWPFESLRSRDVVQLRVRVWAGKSEPGPWSDPLHVEAGLLDAEDWQVEFISPSVSASSEMARPAFLLRAPFTLGEEVTGARLYLAVHGVFEIECNGLKVDDAVLAPGWTSYRHRLEYVTIDLTSHLRIGANALGLWLADGWYRGRLGFNGGLWDVYGQDVAALAQLEVNYRDGRRERVRLEDTWRWAVSPVSATGLYEGENYDSRLQLDLVSSPSLNTKDWQQPAQLPRAMFSADLVPLSRPPVRRIEELRPISIERRPNGRIRLDFGQNISGRLKIEVNGDSGHTVRLHHAEVLEHDELAIRPLRTAAAVDTFICHGRGRQGWEPRFTYHGFRYAELENWPGEVDADSAVAVVLHTDMRRTGWLETSSQDLNRLHENVLWSMRDNFVSIPTDCPQRDERLGWTGDIQVFAPTATYLYDVQAVLNDWLRDLAAEQQQRGSVPNFVPWVECGFPAAPAAAWGDAAVVVPWVLYEQYGDLAALREQYPSMRSWVEQVSRLVEPDGLWTSGFQLGDWLDPTAPPTDPAASRTDRYLVASAYRIHACRLVTAAARALGLSHDARRYEASAEAAAKAFQEEWVTPRGRISSDTVTAYALAIVFDLLDPDQQGVAGARLAELVASSDFTITTGFVGTPLVCDALTRTGNLDAAYHLLLQRNFPSWLYPVEMGATTMWERWDSMLPDGSVNPGEMTSFNHYALGAVADFMHRTIGGLTRTAPGWARVRVAPQPGGGLTWAKAAHETVRGRLVSSWRRIDQRFELDLEIPAGTIAEVVLPDGRRFEAHHGHHHFSCPIRPAGLDPATPRRINIHDPEARRAAASHEAA